MEYSFLLEAHPASFRYTICFMVNMQVYDQIRAGLLHCRQGEDSPSSIVGAMACPRPVTPSTDGNPSSIVGAMSCPRPVTPSTDEYPSSIVGAMACPIDSK